MDDFEAEVDVILPTYDRADMVDRAISSVLNQTYENITLIVVDDASPDETEAVVREFDDKRLEYVRHQENRGQAAAENTGIERSNGEYVAFIDDDVEWVDRKVEKQVEALKHASESIGAVHCGYYHQVGEYLREVPVATAKGDIYDDLLRKDVSITTSKLMVRRECLEECGYWDESLPGFIDYDLCLRIAREYEFTVVPEPLVVSHDHDKARVSTGWETSYNSMNAIIDKWGDEMRARLGSDGVKQYRRQTLQGIYWRTALWNAQTGDRTAAISNFVKYLLSAGFDNPKWIPYFVLTIIGGRSLESFVKHTWFRITGIPRDQADI